VVRAAAARAGLARGEPGSLTVMALPARRPYPWLRSVEESLPRDRQARPRVGWREGLVTAVVLAVVIAVIVWLVFFSRGGIGVGSV
jgi:hypothetical protein